MDAKLNDLPQDREALEAILRGLILERDEQGLRAEQQRLRAEQQTQRADELYVENLRLQLELERYEKFYHTQRCLIAGIRNFTVGQAGKSIVSEALMRIKESADSRLLAVLDARLRSSLSLHFKLL